MGIAKFFNRYFKLGIRITALLLCLSPSAARSGCEEGVISPDAEILEAVNQTVVILKDGSTLPVVEARFTFNRLEDLLHENFLCFAELVAFTRGTIHRLSHSTSSALKRRGLLDREEMLLLAVRKILRNAVPLGQRQLTLESPYAEISESALPADQTSKELPKIVTAMSAPEMAWLKDNQVESRDLVEKIMRRIRVLMERDILAAYDLVQIARNPGHRVSHPHSLQILRLLGLLQPDDSLEGASYGTMDFSTRHIVLNGTHGTFLDLEVVSPYEPLQDGARLMTPAALLETPLPSSAIRQMSLDEMIAYYEKAQAISKYIVEFYNVGNHWMIDRSNESVSPEAGQIMPNGGLALELRDGTPKYLWTPLGKLEISGPAGGDLKPDFEVLRKKLDLKEFIPRDIRSVGAYGPVYRVTQDLDGSRFSDLFERRKDNELSYVEALKQWAKVRPHGRKS